MTPANGWNDLAWNDLSVLGKRVKCSRCRVQSKNDADPTAEYRAYVSSDLPGDAVELAICSLTARCELRPHLVPPLRHLRHALRVSHRACYPLSDTTCALHGLVRPGDPPACGQVRNTLGAYLPAKPGVPERNHHDLLHALVIQERDLLAAEWARLVFAQFSVPWLAAQQDCSAGADPRLDLQLRSSRRSGTVTATDHGCLRA